MQGAAQAVGVTCTIFRGAGFGNENNPVPGISGASACAYHPGKRQSSCTQTYLSWRRLCWCLAQPSTTTTSRSTVTSSTASTSTAMATTEAATEAATTEGAVTTTQEAPTGPPPDCHYAGGTFSGSTSDVYDLSRDCRTNFGGAFSIALTIKPTSFTPDIRVFDFGQITYVSNFALFIASSTSYQLFVRMNGNQHRMDVPGLVEGVAQNWVFTLSTAGEMKAYLEQRLVAQFAGLGVLPTMGRTLTVGARAASQTRNVFIGEMTNMRFWYEYELVCPNTRCLPTPPPGPATTTAAPAEPPASAPQSAPQGGLPGWVWGNLAESCNTVCAAKGGACDPSAIPVLGSEARLREVSDALGAQCSSVLVANSGVWPAHAHAGGYCMRRKDDGVAASCSQSGGNARMFCWCVEPTPPVGAPQSSPQSGPQNGPAAACWRVGERVMIKPGSRFASQAPDGCATVTTDICAGGSAKLFTFDNGRTASYEYEDMTSCATAPAPAPAAAGGTVGPPAASPGVTASAPAGAPASAPAGAPAAAPSVAGNTAPSSEPTSGTAQPQAPGGNNEHSLPGVRIAFAWSGLNCAQLNTPGSTRDNFIQAVEEGILEGLKNPKVTRAHIVTKLFCARRLQASGASGSGVRSESTIDANAVGVPASELGAAVTQAHSAVTTAVQNKARSSGGINGVTNPGELPTVGNIQSEQVATIPDRCAEDVCVTIESSARRRKGLLGLAAALSCTVLAK